MFQCNLILFPTDLSPISVHAFPVVLSLAKTNGSKVLVFHAVETAGSENVTVGEVSTALQPKGYQNRLMHDLMQVHPRGLASTAIEYLITEKDASHEIIRIAQERHCDLIVVGKHGRTGLKRLLMGSTAEYVVRHAGCPVLVLPGPAHSS